MPNVNKFYGVGHLGRDPECRKTQSGTSVTNFVVAINSREKVNDEWTNVAEWVNGVCFGKQAEWLSEARKGDLCIFEGRLKTRSWDKDGQTQYKTEVICDSVQTVKKGNQANMDQSVPDGMDDEIQF